MSALTSFIKHEKLTTTTIHATTEEDREERQREERRGRQTDAQKIKKLTKTRKKQ